MEKALIIGASGGIGGAISSELRSMGWDVTTLSRRDDGFDVEDPSSVESSLAALDTRFSLILIAVGILAPEGAQPEKSLSAIDAASMAQVFAVNTIGPALILGHVPRLLSREGRAIVGVLSARVGSIGDNRLGGWHSYRASKAALNQIVHGAAIELRRSHKSAICVALHPGTVATPFTARYSTRHKTVTPTEAAQNLISVLNGLTPEQSGRFFDWTGGEVPW